MDLLPVTDDTAFVGVVTTTEILKLDEILGRTTGETDVGSRTADLRCPKGDSTSATRRP